MKRTAVFLALAPVFLAVSSLSLAQQATENAAPLPLLTAMYAGAPHLALSHGSWSPDSSRFVFFAAGEKDGGHAGDLMQLDPATGKITVLLAKAKLDALTPAASTSEPEHYGAYASARAMQWAPDGKHLLFDQEGALWWVDLPSGEARHLADTGVAPGDDPKISPDGLRISYLKDHNLVTVPVAGGPESAVTHTDGVGKPVLNGQLDWIYEEELSAQSNYFWSPDSRQIAYLQMDESKVPAYPLVDWIPTHAVTELQRYPQPGDPNPGIRLGVVKAAGGETRWINLPISENNDYIPRFGWLNDHTLWIEVLRRSQKKREFFLADAATGASQAIASDEDPKYLAMNYNAEFLDDGRFLFPSWRDGHTHLYLYRAERTGDTLPQTATFHRELEQGDYEVQSGAIAESFFRVTGYRPAGPKANSVPRIFYISNEGEAIGSRLWTVGMDGSGKRDLTPTEGTHRIQISPNGAYFVDTNSSYSRTPVVALCTTSDGACKELERYTPPAGFHRLEPKPLTLRAADGTPLYGTLTLPASTAPDSVPLVVNPYGGPAVHTISDAWSTDGFDRILVEHGFAVLHVDNRGMGGRSRDFEQVCYHNFGPVELADQLAAVDSVLRQYPQLDPKRLGWMGYSWGGTFTAYALTHSDRFRAGTAGSGVMDWHSYDSIYTERYLGLPVEDKRGYADGSVINSAAGLHGRLLIEQGTADDNAHLQNTIQFIQALIEAGRPYDLELTPGASHRHYEPASDESDLERTLAHFETWLKAAPDANSGAPAGR